MAADECFSLGLLLFRSGGGLAIGCAFKFFDEAGQLIVGGIALYVKKVGGTKVTFDVDFIAFVKVERIAYAIVELQPRSCQSVGGNGSFEFVSIDRYGINAVV